MEEILLWHLRQNIPLDVWECKAWRERTITVIRREKLWQIPSIELSWAHENRSIKTITSEASSRGTSWHQWTIPCWDKVYQYIQFYGSFDHCELSHFRDCAGSLLYTKVSKLNTKDTHTLKKQKKMTCSAMTQDVNSFSTNLDRQTIFHFPGTQHQVSSAVLISLVTQKLNQQTKNNHPYMSRNLHSILSDQFTCFAGLTAQKPV